MNVDEMVERAIKMRSEEMTRLVKKVKHMLKEERKDGIFRLKKREYATIVGDLHGDLESLTFILKDSEFLQNEDYLVFLGDYGDRGKNSPEVYSLILSLKLKYPKRIVLLRGNHEFPPDLRVYPHDLPDYLEMKYGTEGKRVYENILKLFNLLYNAALVEKKYLLLHGGLPVNTSSIEDIEFAHKTHPQDSNLEEILWNDPIEGKGYYPSPRGAGKIFGEDVTERILKKLEVKTLIRSHEPCDGVKVNHGGRILTLFSRKGSPYFNKFAAYLRLNLKEEAKDAYELSEIAKKF